MDDNNKNEDGQEVKGKADTNDSDKDDDDEGDDDGEDFLKKMRNARSTGFDPSGNQ